MKKISIIFSSVFLMVLFTNTSNAQTYSKQEKYVAKSEQKSALYNGKHQNTNNTVKKNEAVEATVVESCKYQNVDEARNAMPDLVITQRKLKGEILNLYKQKADASKQQAAEIDKQIETLGLELQSINADFKAAELLISSNTTPTFNSRQ